MLCTIVKSIEVAICSKHPYQGGSHSIANTWPDNSVVTTEAGRFVPDGILKQLTQFIDRSLPDGSRLEEVGFFKSMYV